MISHLKKKTTKLCSAANLVSSKLSKVIFTLSEQCFGQSITETGISVFWILVNSFDSWTSCNQHWLALHYLAFLTSTGTTTALLCWNPALGGSPPTSPMTSHIFIPYSGCQGEETHHPTNCSSSDGAALHHTSQVQHQRRGDGWHHHGRSTGKALPRSWQTPAEAKWPWWPAALDA